MAGPAVAFLATLPGSHAQTTERVSLSSSEAQGNNSSEISAISADGRLVAFYSFASDLVAGDANFSSDIFVRDRQTGLTTRVSVASDATEANGASFNPSISADGRFVAFYSVASNLVAGDTNNAIDVFVHELQTGLTTRVSVSSLGAQSNGESLNPALSADGRFVAFASVASNLVVGDTNFVRDIFVHDRQTGSTTRVSVSSAGAQGAQASGGSFDSYLSISGDGRLVAFHSAANSLVTGDTNGWPDVFVHDRQTSQTIRVSVDGAGTQGDSASYSPNLSSDGRFVAFHSFASNLVPGDTNAAYDVFVRDLQPGGGVTRVSVDSSGAQPNGPSNTRGARMTGDGRFVVFDSAATNLVPGDTNNSDDVFVHDRQTGATTRASVSTAGAQATSLCLYPSISDSGRFVSFHSTAINLVPGDTNNVGDVFVRDRQAACAGDANGDGVVNFIDLNLVLSAFGACAADPNFIAGADLNGDGCVNFLDLNLVLSFFGAVC